MQTRGSFRAGFSSFIVLYFTFTFIVLGLERRAASESEAGGTRRLIGGISG